MPGHPEKQLARLASAFAPVGPFRGAAGRNRAAATSARATQKAVTSLSRSRGISTEKAKAELIKTAGQIKKTRRTLSKLRVASGKGGRKVSIKERELASRAGVATSLAALVLRTTPKRR